MDQDRQKRLNDIAAIAVGLEYTTKVPAVTVITVWAIESEWGETPVGRANYHGIKYVPGRHRDHCMVETHEYINGKDVLLDLEFADFDSLQASAEDFCYIVSETPVYTASWRSYLLNKDAQVLMFDIAKKYATDPKYSRIALQIFGQTNIKDAINSARRQPKAA